MEIELEPRVKPLPYKVKATSRESTSQKATHVLDTDLRNHWSTATNTKEWILLELDEPCLLSHIRIYNKSVLEWEISVGLRYKPETFVKVRPRCEAPRRDMIYPTNYTPTRYVRISCLRGNPIALFFIELIGVSIVGLEPEFQPVVNYLLPHIISHKQEAHDMHLQLLQEMTSRLVIFLPQLEADLNSFSDAAEPNMRFLAMLAGPFYPILHIVNERETARLAGNVEPETSKNSPTSSGLTVSSNFESRRFRSASPTYLPTSSSVVFRPDLIFSLLRKAYQDSHLGTVCRMACRIIMKLVGPIEEIQDTTVADVASKSEPHNHVPRVDYSNMFGEEFRMLDDPWDSKYCNLLDIKAVEEGILHVLYACASQPLLCSKLADDTSDFWSALPLVQALLPALRPTFTTADMVDDSFSQWKQPFVQHALSQIVATSSSSVYCPILHACAGYLSSYSPSHARAACVLIDLCSGLLAPWIPQVLAKVDLAMELLEDLLGVIQGARHSLTRARAALNHIVLALSGHMDDIMPKYKDAKHQILFLIEMLEPFLDSAITPLRSMKAFGNVSPSFVEKQEQTCLIALNVIRTAVTKSAVLPSLESEWKRGSVAPSVLLSVLEPHIQLPPDIDHRKFPLSDTTEPQQIDLNSEEDSEGKTETSDSSEDIALLFAPQELKNMQLTNVSMDKKSNNSDSSQQEQVNTVLGSGYAADEYSNLNLDYSQLMNYRDCELLASEFRRLASDLHTQNEITLESHNASINALLLAAECYVNPFFVMSFKDFPKVNHTVTQPRDTKDLRKILTNNAKNMENVAHLERKRDKFVIQILLEAAKLEMEYKKTTSNDEQEETLDLSDADAITLVRQNQALLCEFLIQRLQKEKNSVQEILIQSLVFLLRSATKLYCSPEDIIDIILESTEHFNVLLTSYYHQFKEGNLHLYPFRVHEIQRKWMLLQSLVIASSGNEEDKFSKKTGFFQFSKLVPSSVWMHKIPNFSSSPYPMIRFLGWMAVSRNANQYKKEKLFLTSNLSDLTILLSIFGDDLAVVEQNAEQYLHNLYPDICQFLPNTKKEFESFGEIILEAVGLQLRSLSSSTVPDILCWFSDLCLWPLAQKSQNKSDLLFKGFVAKNAKAIILYVLESIIIEHMEAIVPEVPRVVQVLVSLSKASYCDVDFLESILRLLKPIISYSLRKVSEEEKESDDNDSSLTFEYLCFEELFSNIRCKNEDIEDKSHSKALTIFILASVFADLSFQKKREILQSLILCADFALCGSTTSCYDYICAFQSVLGSCKGLLVENLRVHGALPLKESLDSDLKSNLNFDEISKIHPWFPDYVTSNQMGNSLSDEEVMNFSNDLEDLISELNPTIELCWKLHHVLAKKLALTSAQCYMYSKILSSIAEYASITPEGDSVNSLHHWNISLNELTETILILQDKNCWEIASMILDSVLDMPRCFDLSNVIRSICNSIDKFSSNAPKITWRLQSDKWLSNLLTRGAYTAQGSEIPLVNLLCKMLGHSEPEQRFIALQHLGKLTGQNSYGGPALTSSLDLVVSSTWDRVAVLAASDLSLHLRTRAIILLLDYVPFAERRLLQSVLISADSVLHDLMNLADNNCEGPLIRVSLALIAHVCLYSPSEDIFLIPQSIWRNIEALGNSETERKSGDVERKACHALCRLRNDGDEAKEILKEVLASTATKEVDPDFGSTRESILQVLANLTSVQSYFDVFSKKIDQKDMELEEAEMEFELLQKEQTLRDSSNDVNDWCQHPLLATYAKKDENRLQQIKDSIRSIEKAKLKEEIITRRQKKLLMKQARQTYLEEACLRETELLQKLDSERSNEVEREIERQQMLEIERAKTRELRHNLEIEKEKQSQRELQRDLEQAESGIRPSRREYPSSHSSRGRDRFRDRDNNRQNTEVNTRTNNASLHSEAPAVILSGSSRTYSGQIPTILQPSRDRQDDGAGSGYEEGSRDSGDTGSVGDPDLVSALEGQAGVSGSGQRHGSRGGKSRQIMERREREGRREGKWERKH